MLLLTQKKEMTVTQMSNYIGVTRTNLYNSIVELVRDGMVSEPEVQVKKNYVEKYYRLNTLAFRAIDPFELQKRLNQGAGPSEYKDLLESFFICFSLYFKIYAHVMSESSREQLEEVSKELKEERILLSALSLDDDEYAYELKEIRTLLKKGTIMREKTAKQKTTAKVSDYFSDDNRIFVIALPKSVALFVSSHT